MSAAFVRFDDVSLAYDGTGNAIEDINLSIREGEFVAFVGPSGCGKSTFMKLCTHLPKGVSAWMARRSPDH